MKFYRAPWGLAYINNYKRAVVLKFSSRTVVVSPENPADFADELSRKEISL